ncbi:MAG TPA: hypothetical protein VMH49_03600 [Thermoplasmata archaeon]|nr:hypothetical protein [Thermoplasmata archaeon]
MTALAPGTAVLFVASDPVLAEQRRNAPESMSAAGRLFLPPLVAIHRIRRRPGTDPTDGLGIPAAQLLCAQRAIDTAAKLHRQLRIVDVNDPGDDADLAGRFVTAEDVLPVLARADGQRLVGEEAFAPSTLRVFFERA